MRRLLKRNTFIAIIAALVVIFIIGIMAVKAITNKDTSSTFTGPSVNISKSFTAIGRTQDGRATDGTVPIKLTNAQITDNVLIQGQTATTKNGKLFLVVYMEAENKYQVPLYTTALDLLRLVRSDGKRIAPSVSQGNVELRPISVKRTNVAFVIDRSEKNFTIELGEVKGSKEAVQVNFK